MPSKSITHPTAHVHGDVIVMVMSLTPPSPSSSVVQCCLIDAHRSGKKFKVVVVSSRPKLEGKCVLEDGQEEWPRRMHMCVFGLCV